MPGYFWFKYWLCIEKYYLEVYMEKYSSTYALCFVLSLHYISSVISKMTNNRMTVIYFFIDHDIVAYAVVVFTCCFTQ